MSPCTYCGAERPGGFRVCPVCGERTYFGLTGLEWAAVGAIGGVAALVAYVVTRFVA